MRCGRVSEIGGLAIWALLATGAGAALAQTTPAARVATPVATPILSEDQKVAALLKLIADTLASMPATSKREDIEGRLSFAIDQAQPDCSVSKVALSTAAADPTVRPTAKAALRNLAFVLSRCQNTGTAALASAQSVVSLGSSLTLGGGTSNYVGP